MLFKGLTRHRKSKRNNKNVSEHQVPLCPRVLPSEWTGKRCRARIAIGSQTLHALVLASSGA